MFDIKSYWLPRLGKRDAWAASALKGWVADPGITEAFVEPALTLKIGDPQTSDVVIVAAPGAVGKTTFARTIAHSFGLAYVDLAETSPLGGNFFTGGLTRAFGKDALQAASEGKLGLIVDGLDEAQMRATPDGFAAGVEDLATLISTAAMKKCPPVLFGRSLAAEEAWITLSGAGHTPCLLEIDFFDEERATKYISSRMAALAKTSPAMTAAFASHHARFIDLGIETRKRLVSAGGGDSNRFTGYAPILDAICAFALDENELNPQSKFSRLYGQTQVELVAAVCDAVLLREQMKVVNQLLEVCPAQHHDVARALYNPEEQRARLSQVLFGSPMPLLPALPTAGMSRSFLEMVERFFPNHPFLDGSGRASANAVFSADLLVDSLFSEPRKQAALQAARTEQRLVTGLVFDLYIQRLKSRASQMPLQDVGVLYESLKAQTSAQHRATLEISQAGEGDDVVEVEFEIVKRSDPAKPERAEGPFMSSTETMLELRTPMTNVFISAPVWATLGDSSGLLIDAPCEVNVQSLTIAAKHVLVQGTTDDGTEETSVILTADEADTNIVQSVIVQNTKLSVSWPHSRQHPWINYSFEPPSPASADIEFIRRRLRRILTAFRSHSKGALVRLAAKIDHLRMTKDKRGAFLVERLISDGLLSPFDSGKFYVLDAKKMAQLMNVNYFALQLQQYTKQSDAYLENVLSELSSR